jgi:hypothetical protein
MRPVLTILLSERVFGLFLSGNALLRSPFNAYPVPIQGVTYRLPRFDQLERKVRPLDYLTLEKVYGKPLAEFEKDWIAFVQTLK